MARDGGVFRRMQEAQGLADTTHNGTGGGAGVGLGGADDDVVVEEEEVVDAPDGDDGVATKVSVRVAAASAPAPAVATDAVVVNVAHPTAAAAAVDGTAIARNPSTATRRSRQASDAASPAAAAPGAAAASKPSGDKKDAKGKDADDEDVKGLPEVPASRLWRMQAPEGFVIVLGVLGAAVAGATMPLFSIVFARMVDVFYRDNATIRDRTPFFMGESRLLCGLRPLTRDSATLPTHGLPPVTGREGKGGEGGVSATRRCALPCGRAGMFFLLGGGAMLGHFAQHTAFAWAGEKLTRRIRVMVYGSVMRQEVGWFDQPSNSPGRLATRLATDAALLKATTGDQLGVTVQAMFALVGAIVISFTASWAMSLIVLGLFPVIVIVGVVQVKLLAGFNNSKPAEQVGGWWVVMCLRVGVLWSLRRWCAHRPSPLPLLAPSPLPRRPGTWLWRRCRPSARCTRSACTSACWRSLTRRCSRWPPSPPGGP